MAERRSRIDLYVGPKATITRADLPRYEASGEWVAEEKKDGEWCLATFRDGVLTGVASRTGLPLGAPDLVGRVFAPEKPQWSGQLVGELVADVVEADGETERSGTRRLHLFEPLNWNGIDLRDQSLEERREALEMIYATFENVVLGDAPLIELIERRGSDFQKWYDSIMGNNLIGSGAEGLVLKKKGTPARAQNSDGKVDFWVRCKPLCTVDYVVLGDGGKAEKGTPKIALGLYKNGSLVKVTSPSWPAKIKDLRAGMVVEVEGLGVWPSGAVRHGHVKRVRTDKRPEDCTYEAAIASGGIK